MKWLLKILMLAALWSVVGGMIVYVDPVLIRDVWIRGAYLPMGVALSAALYATLRVMIKPKIKAVLTMLILMLALYLTAYQLMYWFVGLGITVSLIVILTSVRQS